MYSFKKASLTAAVVLLFAGSAAAATPSFPGAKAVEAKDPMKQTLEVTIQQMNKAHGTNSKTEAYALPAGTNWDKVAEFYNSKLPGFKELAKMKLPTGGSATWNKDNKETVAVTFMNNPATPTGAPYLIVTEAEAPTSTSMTR